MFTKLQDIPKRIKRFVLVSSHTYRQGTNLTRFNLIIGYLLFFLPFFIRKQLIKAFSYLAIFAGYLIFMLTIGGKNIGAMMNLSLHTGDRRQPLVYGIIALILTVFVIFYLHKSSKR